jgi:hypothetical protein
MNITVTIMLAIFVCIFIYFLTVNLFRIDFKNSKTRSLIEIISPSLGLLLSVPCLIVYSLPNIDEYTKLTVTTCLFSFFVPLFGVLTVFAGISFNTQILNNKTLDIATKIISIILGISGIALSIALGRII